ncbi:MAG TPA: hypothetical protein VI912_00295 [Candidatus Bilamarchaeaceae archaeon]|nr:hypothetical protein [Candidatus Bilamarchaeaceae archaeon]
MELDINDLKKRSKIISPIENLPKSDLTISLNTINKNYTEYLIQVRDTSAKTPVLESEILSNVTNLAIKPLNSKK